jgi:hypothetical protein
VNAADRTGVVVYSMTDVPLGFGTSAKSTNDARKMDPGGIVVFHQVICFYRHLWAHLFTKKDTKLDQIKFALLLQTLVAFSEKLFQYHSLKKFSSNEDVMECQPKHARMHRCTFV